MNIVQLDIENSRTRDVITLELNIINNDEGYFVFDISKLDDDVLNLLVNAIDKKLTYTDIEMFYVNGDKIPYFGPDYDFKIDNDRLYASLRTIKYKIN